MSIALVAHDRNMRAATRTKTSKDSIGRFVLLFRGCPTAAAELQKYSHPGGGQGGDWQKYSQGQGQGPEEPAAEKELEKEHARREREEEGSERREERELEHEKDRRREHEKEKSHGRDTFALAGSQAAAPLDAATVATQVPSPAAGSIARLCMSDCS